MTNLLNWDFWFSLNPGPLTPVNQKIFIGLIIFLAVAAILILMIKRKGGIYKGVLNSLYLFFLSNTLIALIIFFFNYELIPFFSARFWLAIWVLAMIIWKFFIFRKLRLIPLRKKTQDQEKELKKYLP